MSDLYSEQLVTKRATGADAAKKILLMALTVLSIVLLLFVPVLIFVPVLMIVLDVFLLKRINVEYEYLYVNGELDIDKIMGKEKRKQQLSMNMDSLEIMAPKGSHELDPFRNRQMKTMNFTSCEPDARVYEMVVKKDNGQLRVYFEPNDAIVEAMYMTAPRKVKKAE